MRTTSAILAGVIAFTLAGCFEGKQGPAGTTGPAGAAGPQGERGVAGPAGPAPVGLQPGRCRRPVGGGRRPPAGAPGPNNARVVQIESCIGGCNNSCAAGEVVASAMCLSSGPATAATVAVGQTGAAWQISCPIGSARLVAVCMKP